MCKEIYIEKGEFMTKMEKELLTVLQKCYNNMDINESMPDHLLQEVEFILNKYD